MKLTLEWMEWTVPTAIFCITIILTVIGNRHDRMADRIPFPGTSWFPADSDHAW